MPPRPDSRYGVSKAFGEALGRFYADKFGLGVLCIRIGNFADRPLDRRRLSIWLSPRDFRQLVRIGLEHPDLHYETVYGASESDRAWWDNANAYRLGYRPEDESEPFAAEILAAETEAHRSGGRALPGWAVLLGRVRWRSRPDRIGPVGVSPARANHA